VVCFHHGTIYYHRQIPDDDPIGGASGLELKAPPEGFLRGAGRWLRRHAAGTGLDELFGSLRLKRAVASPVWKNKPRAKPWPARRPKKGCREHTIFGGYEYLAAFSFRRASSASASAKKLFSEAAAGDIVLDVSPVIVAETIYTLLSFYGVERKEAVEKLLMLLRQPV